MQAGSLRYGGRGGLPSNFSVSGFSVSLAPFLCDPMRSERRDSEPKSPAFEYFAHDLPLTDRRHSRGRAQDLIF